MTVFESVKRFFVSEKTPVSKIAKSYGIGEQPDVSFAKLIEYHDKTPQISIGVTGYAELILGTELQINADDEQAKELIEKWNKDTNFYEKLKGLVNTLLICGNAILEKLDENEIIDVLEVDMTTIIKKERDESGSLLYYTQQTNEGPKRLGENNQRKFVEFNLTNYSRKPWSPGIFNSITMPRTVRDRTYLPLVEMLWAIEDSMGAIILNNAHPFRMVTFENMSDKEMDKHGERFRRYHPGDTYLTNKKPEIDLIETQQHAKYTEWIAHIEDAIQLGIKFPSDILTGDFTSRASSDTTESLTMKIAKAVRYSLLTKVTNEIYNEILTQNGYDPEKVNLTASLATQEIIKLSPETVATRFEKKIWSLEEVREWDKQNTGVDLFDDDVMNNDKSFEDAQRQADIEVNKFQQVQQAKGNPMNNFKYEKKRRCQACKESQHTFCTKRGCQCREGIGH